MGLIRSAKATKIADEDLGIATELTPKMSPNRIANNGVEKPIITEAMLAISIINHSGAHIFNTGQIEVNFNLFNSASISSSSS